MKPNPSMTRVFIVYSTDQRNGDNVEGVYSTKKLARAAITKWKETWPELSYFIQVIALDEPI